MDALVWSRAPVGQRSTNKRGKIWQRFLRKINRERTPSRRPALMKPTCMENTEEFTKNTNLHALKFVGDRSLSFFERIFFLIAFVTALSLALNYTMDIFEKWSSTPVIIANNAKSTYISEIPFPAVTICNMNQAMKSRVSGLDRDSASNAVLQTMCNRRQDVRNSNVSITWEEFENFILDSTQPCSQMLLNCRFGSVEFNCTDLFQVTLTDEGLCCTYNAVDPVYMFINHRPTSGNAMFMPKNHVAVDWTPEDGYPRQRPKRYYPTPAVGTGYTMGLTVVMNADIDEYHCSSSNGAGMKVSLHSPIETPDVGDIGFSLAAGTETRVVITPQLADASRSIRDLAKATRQCVFDAEMNLTHFRTYSRRNCEMECEARILAHACKCIFSYMPRIYRDVSVCGPKDADCYDSVNANNHVANTNSNNCSAECLPACYDLTYDAATFAAPILGGPFMIRRQIIQDMAREFAEKNILIAHFYYVENAFRSKTKEEYVGITEFLSRTGGLMGLFIGFSIISIVEFTYYASIRPFCASRRYKRSLDKPVEEINSKTTRKLPENSIEIIQQKVGYTHHSRKFKKIQRKNWTLQQFGGNFDYIP